MSRIGFDRVATDPRLQQPSTDAAARPDASRLAEPPTPPATTPAQRTDQALSGYQAAVAHRDQALRDAVPNAYERAEIRREEDAKVDQARHALDTAVAGEIGPQVDAANAGIPGEYRRPDGELITSYGKVILQRHADDPGAQTALKASVADYQIQRKADNAIPVFSDSVPAQDRIATLKTGLHGMPQAVLDRVAQDPRVQQWVRDAADWAGAPYRDAGLNGSEQASEAAQRLGELAEGLPPALTTQLAQQALPTLQKIAASPLLHPDEPTTTAHPGTFENLSRVVSALGDAPQADTLKQQIVQAYVDNQDVGKWSALGGVALGAIGNGASPELAIGIAKALKADGNDDAATDVMKGVLAGVESFKGQVTRDAKEYGEKAAELSWFAGNLGPAMSQDQREHAIQDYLAQRGPDWRRDFNASEAQLSEDGARLTRMLGQLQGVPDALKASVPDLQEKLDGYAKDETIQHAVEFATTKDPSLLEGEDGEHLLEFYAENVEKGNVAREFGGHLFQQWMTGHLLGKLEGFDPADPASRASVTSALGELRDSKWAQLLGVERGNLDKAVSIVEDSLSQPGESAALTEARLKSLDANLGRVTGFGEGSAAGVLFRIAGVAAAGLGVLNAGQKALTDPSTMNTLSLFSQAAGLTRYGVDFGKVVGVIGEKAPIAGGPATVFLSAVAATSDLVQAGVAFFGKDGDPVEGVLTGLRGLSTFALFAAEDPLIGVPAAIVWGVATLGLGWREHVEDANQYEPDHNDGRTAAFLEHIPNLSHDAALALSDQSGDGYSVVPTLARYAQSLGYDLDDPQQQQTFVAWLNGMDTDTLSRLRDGLHHLLDDNGGDLEQLAYASANADLGPGAAGYSREQLVDIGLGMVIGRLSLDERVPFLPSR